MTGADVEGQGLRLIATLRRRYCWYQCTVKGGREARDLDAHALVVACEALGAGEVLLNCMDKVCTRRRARHVPPNVRALWQEMTRGREFNTWDVYCAFKRLGVRRAGTLC
jgi:hypothetical protein